MVSDAMEPPYTYGYISDFALPHYKIFGSTVSAGVRGLCVYALVCFSRHDSVGLANAIEHSLPSVAGTLLRVEGSVHEVPVWRSPSEVNVFGFQLKDPTWVATSWHGRVDAEFELRTTTTVDVPGTDVLLHLA